MLAAHVLQVQAIDTVYVDFKNAEGCSETAVQRVMAALPAKLQSAHNSGGADRFCGQSQRGRDRVCPWVAAAFEGGEGAVSLDDKLLDILNLKSARRILGQGN